jgi:DnaJ-domain-containing protein 1
LVLVTLGIGLALSARRAARPSSNRGEKSEPLSLKEARDLLGVSQTASKAEIREAYNRLMRMAHPDHGGTTGLAAQLNAARDRLLKGS